VIKFKELVKEAGGAGDWGTDEARKKLQKDTPGQGITDIGVKNKERNESYYDKSKYRFKKRELDHELGHETKGNQGIYIDGKLWKVVGKEATAKKIVKTLLDKGKNATYMHTNKPVSESVELDEATDFRAGDTVYQVGSKLKGTVLHKGNQDKIVVKFGSINKMIPASQLRLAEEVELDEGTLAARDESIIDSMLSALKQKLIKDLEDGDMKNAQEVAKLVKMTIEKDYKHKGFSRLKR